MESLFDTIRELVADQRYVVGQHASERLDERGILEWQVVAGLDDGKLLIERPTPGRIRRSRSANYCQDGTEIKAVWSYLQKSGVAKLVTVHFLE